MHKTLILVPVWGQSFIDCAFDGLCRCLQQPRNQAFIEKNSVSMAFITIDQENAEVIARRAAEFPELEISTYVPPHPLSASDFSYVTMIKCTNYGIELAMRDGCNAIFANPDAIFNDGFLSYVHDQFSNGFKAIVALGLRAVKERYYEALTHGGVDFSAGALTNFALENLHPITATHFWEDGRASAAIHYWWQDESRNTLLAHAFHMHPVAVNHSALGVPLEQTIDHEYLQEYVQDETQVAIVTDAREMIVVELSSQEYRFPESLTALTLRDNIEWAERWTNRFHRYYYGFTLTFDRGEFSQPSVAGEVEAIKKKAMELYSEFFDYCRSMNFEKMPAYHLHDYELAKLKRGPFGRNTALARQGIRYLLALVLGSDGARWMNRELRRVLPQKVYSTIRFGIVQRLIKH